MTVLKETYHQLRTRHQKEFDSAEYLGACIAPKFQDQFLKKMRINKMDEVVHIGFGMFCRKDKLGDYESMLKRHRAELEQAIDKDTDGSGFVFSMFYYELSNHECQITGDPSDALRALGYNLKQVIANAKLKHGYNLAVNKLMLEE